MLENSLRFANYWRNSLADAELGSGAFQASDTKEFQTLSRGTLATGCVDRLIVQECFTGEVEQTQVIEVVIRPKVYCLRVEHGNLRHIGAPEILTPIVTFAKLARDGRLYPLPRTVVPRDILEPLENGSFSIGHLTDQDSFLTTDAVPGIDPTSGDLEPLSESDFGQKWAAYFAACNRLFEHVGHGWPGAEDYFELADFGYLVKKESFQVSKNILPLYDHIRGNRSSAPLFDHYASTNISPPEPCLPAHAKFSLRLAHPSDEFPLASAQRNGLAHLLVAEAGEILAINGPPGTGKTTLLLSVVASLWAKAALDGGEPPVILAASSNNQAVTNIIDAFGQNFAIGKGPFAGRWLPELKSFGAYFPAASKEAAAAIDYQTHIFFDTVETADYVVEAQVAYLHAAAQALPNTTAENFTVQAAVDALRKAIQGESEKLTAIEGAWANLNAARDAVRVELGDDPEGSRLQRQQEYEVLEAENRAIEDLAKRWEHFLAQEPLLYSLFSWLPPVSRKRMRLVRLFLKSIGSPQRANGTWETVEQIEITFKARGRQSFLALQERRRSVSRAESVLQVEQDCLAKWRVALTPLDVAERADSLSLAECDTIADTLIRFPIFLLTTHYWEGRWLLEMQAQLPNIAQERKKNGRVACEKRWRQRMKLTPCIVSTFFMLPKEMQVRRHTGNDFKTDYLYDFADLLIVDEAGQVLPEVAGASFALCKKALIIGDTQQIEPIWSIPARVDIGNLCSFDLLANDDYEDAYHNLSRLGKTVASGSVMQIAQSLTRYHQDRDLARGLFLYEHRRCFDEIINYCNVLCYQGKLIPMRGAKAQASEISDELPAMGYLHIDGLCQKSGGTSRQNLHEADTIAAWLAEHKNSLESMYAPLRLHQIVGVVTPFGAQVRAITTACRDVGIKAGSQGDGMTVGTVHSLQGAERPIVIFSSVYSKHADGVFIDNNLSMLNVAVSRAKNSFLVFGDMDVFSLAPKGSPRGLLLTQLSKDSTNSLQFEHRPRRDLKSPQVNFRTLRDAREHDDFLLDTLANVVREAHIVTPWFNLERTKYIGAMEAMRAAVQRGVKVTVYTDPEFNTGDDQQRRQKKREILLSAADTLRNAGIETVFVEKVHSKLLLGDDDLYCVGSFNWFSADRDGPYARHETSLAYRSPRMAIEIETSLKSLKRRIVSVDPIPRRPMPNLVRGQSSLSAR